jgi:SRSO17 transposase
MFGHDRRADGALSQANGPVPDGSCRTHRASERRHWAAVYVRGLLLNGERKSIEPLASRLPDGNVQALQQFIGQSPWEWDVVWERLGKRMIAELEPDTAWVVDDTGFAKQGSHSVGVTRQYSGTLGKTGNCQIAVSVHHVGEQGNAPLGWRLYLPEIWASDEQRRQEAGIPARVVFGPKWELALDIIDQIRGWAWRIAWCWRMLDTASPLSFGRNWSSDSCATSWEWGRRLEFGSSRHGPRC